MDLIQVIVGGIKAEYETIKNEGHKQSEDSIVEIKAEDIGESIKKEPEENSKPSGNNESNIISNGVQLTERNKINSNYYNTRSQRQQITPETEKNERNQKKKENIQEKLLINYTATTNLLNTKEKIKSTIRIRALSRKPVKKSVKPKRKNDLKNTKFIQKNEFSLEKNLQFRLRYRCNHCQTVMTNRRNILHHIRHQHRDAAIFEMVEAETLKWKGTSASRKVEWYEYILEGNDQYRCRHCQLLVDGQQQATKHIRTKHRVFPIAPFKKCPLCPFQARDLKNHKQFYHTDEKDIEYFRCHRCDFKGRRKFDLKKHILAMHTDPNEILEQMYKCTQCPRMFKLREKLNKHVGNMHTVNFEKLKCFHCPYMCKAKISMETHIDYYHRNLQVVQPKQCPHCPFNTKIKDKLRRHVYRNHRNIRQCHMCTYQSPHNEVMRLHIIGHKKDKDEEDLKYRCDRCDYKTYRIYNLQIHKLNHLKPEEIEYFYCYHCNFKAKRKDNLKSHIFRHYKKKELTFQCYICDFSTKKKDQLIRHIDKHSEESKNEKKPKTGVILPTTD